MSTAVVDPEAKALWEQFQALAAERKHNLSRDMMTRPATMPQLKALIGFLNRQPRKPALQAQPTSREVQQSRKQAAVQETGIPEGRYAIKSLTGNNDLDFYEIKYGKEGKWKGFCFVEQIVGGHDNFPVRNRDRKNQIFKAIRGDGIEASQLLAAQALGICMDCHRELTDELSRKLGRGPVCREK